jgi:SAM-dependent MidA family methyltransferase
MTPLATRILDRIQRSGPLPFDEFMRLALYDETHGYYSSGRAQIGRGGDFYTSVSVGRVFGRLLARQFAEMWDRLGRPGDFTIVEEGADRGDFACDVLEGMQDDSPECFGSLRYLIVEPSAALRHAQLAKLGELAPTVEIVNSRDELPAFSGVHFSNELIDAFPVVRVQWTGKQWLEQCVSSDGEAFCFVSAPLRPDAALRSILSKVPEPVQPGHVAEVNLETVKWLREISGHLRRGWVFAFDYGHTRAEFFDPARRNGTLSAYSQHQRQEDPLQRPGEVDLTAHVEFTSLAEAAESLGLRLCGFTDQHHAMVGLGKLHFEDATSLDAAQQRDLRGFQTLMHPGLMGRAFKAICFSRGVEDEKPLAAFAYARDSRAVLGLTCPSAE